MVEFYSWILFQRTLPTGEVGIVYALTYGRARLGVGAGDLQVFRDVW